MLGISIHSRHSLTSDGDSLLARTDFLGNIHIDAVRLFNVSELPSSYKEATCQIVNALLTAPVEYVEQQDDDLMNEGIACS